MFVDLSGMIKAGLSLAVCVGIIALLARGFSLTNKDKNGSSKSGSSSSSSTTNNIESK